MSPGLKNGFGAANGLTVRIDVKAKAHVGPGRKVGGAVGFPGTLRHGTAPGCAANCPISAWSAAVVLKILVEVKIGTAFWASCINPSNAANRNVLSFLIGKPMEAPNCSRLSESLTCVALIGTAGLNT